MIYIFMGIAFIYLYITFAFFCFSTFDNYIQFTKWLWSKGGQTWDLYANSKGINTKS